MWYILLWISLKKEQFDPLVKEIRHLHHINNLQKPKKKWIFFLPALDYWKKAPLASDLASIRTCRMFSSVRSRGGRAAEIVKERHLRLNAFGLGERRLGFLSDGIRVRSCAILGRLEREEKERTKPWKSDVVEAITFSFVFARRREEARGRKRFSSTGGSSYPWWTSFRWMDRVGSTK